MKLLHVIASLNPKGGGPTEGILQISRISKQFGFEVEVVCLDKPDAPWLQNLNFQVYPLGCGKLNYSYNKNLLYWLKGNQLRYDAIVINGIWQYHAFATWLALRHSGKPYFVYTHGMLDPWFKRAYPLKHIKKWLYWPWADYRVLRDARAVLFTCEEEMRLAPQTFWLYKANGRVVKYGAATPPQDADRLRRLFLETYPDLQGKRNMLFLGRIHEKKGCDLLIDAFARVTNLDPTVQLVMAGPDQTGWAVELRSQAERLRIAHRISWMGMLQGELKWGAFYASELFVLPSHQENFGIAVAEALGCGLPVVISDKVNIWREIAMDGAGLVGNDDVHDTERNLRHWLQLSVADRQHMSEQARSTFTNRYTVEQMAQSLVSTIRELL